MAPHRNRIDSHATEYQTGREGHSRPKLLSSFPTLGRRPCAENKSKRELPWDEDAHPATPTEEEDEDEVAEADEVVPVEDAEENHGPDDALGLYLRQMGAIPLLNRQQELALAQRLDFRRTRYRHAALWNWRTLKKVVDAFERILAGKLAIDPTIDVVTTLGLSRENILKRMPHNVRTLKQLLGVGRNAVPRTAPLQHAVVPQPCAANCIAGCARRSCWPRSCRRVSTCSTCGPTN